MPIVFWHAHVFVLATKQPGPEVQLLKGSQAPLSNEPNTTPISAVSSVHISVVDTESPKLENYDSAEPIVSAGETSHMAALNRVRMTAPAHGRHEASRLRSGSDVGRPRIESSRPRTRSALQKLGATTLFPAAPADTVLGVLASTVGDSRRHRMRVTIAGEVATVCMCLYMYICTCIYMYLFPLSSCNVPSHCNYPFWTT